MHNVMRSGSVRLWQRRLILSIFVTIPVIYFALVSLFGEQIIFAQELTPWSTLILFVAATIAMIYLGGSFFRSTLRGLRERMFNVDSLVTIGTTTAYVYSWISYIVYIIQNHTVLMTDQFIAPRLYFETVILLFTFVTLGKWIENRAADRTEQSVRQLVKLRPRRAHLINGGNIVDIPADEIQLGDRLMVRPEEVIPIDGRVVGGESAVNESMITGESSTIDKHIGSRVIAGTINGHGQLEIVAERTKSNTMLSQIIRLINGAKSSRTPIEGIADRISSVFVPFVIVIALITFAIWYFYVGINASSAMVMFISVIMVACPYAFGLAAPTAMTVGIGLGSRNGILVRDSGAMQRLSNIDTVVFDKTGTLTDGKLSVTDVIAIDGSAKQVMTIASSIERLSEHSLAKAIIKKANSQHLETLPVKHFTAIPGRGVSGIINSTTYFLGNEALAREYIHHDLPDVSKLAKASKTINYLFTTHKVLGVIAVADQPKVNAAKAIRELHKMKINTYLLSGDNEAVTRNIARRLGIKNIIADVMPDDKANEIISLRKKGYTVAMVGDGINDAPAIASANVGIAIGTGTDAAIETGDIVLVNGDPLAICNAIRLAKATVSKVHQNLFFAVFYNIVSLPVAAGALGALGIVFRPELAALIMALSSTAIIVNSLTLKIIDITKQREVIRLIAPLVLFLLFTVIYIEFVYGSSLHAWIYKI